MFTWPYNPNYVLLKTNVMPRNRNSFEPLLPYCIGFSSALITDVVYSSIIVTLFGSVVQISGGPTLHGNLLYQYKRNTRFGKTILCNIDYN